MVPDVASYHFHGVSKNPVTLPINSAATNVHALLLADLVAPCTSYSDNILSNALKMERSIPIWMCRQTSLIYWLHLWVGQQGH